MHLVRLEIPSHPSPTPFVSRTSIAMSSSRGYYYASASSSDPGSSLVERLLRRAVRTNVSVTRVDPITSTLHRVYILSTNQNIYYILETPPPRVTRLLRHEADALLGKAHVLSHLNPTGELRVLPAIIQNSSSTNNSLSEPYILRTYLPGSPLSSCQEQLSSAQRGNIDYQVGQFLRHIMDRPVPTGTEFGLPARVLEGNGHQTWRTAFSNLVETALRDGEDLLVSLPYEQIRYWIYQNIAWMDAIKHPALVSLTAGQPQTVLVNMQNGTLTGLLGWGSVVFGDKAMASVFNGASAQFWQGYGSNDVLLEDGGDQPRSLMYTVYRSILAINLYYYRPHSRSDEAGARRTLEWALVQLAALAE